MAHRERVETEAVAAGGQEDEAVVAVIAVVAVTVGVALAVIVVEALPVIVFAVAMVATESALTASLSCRDQTSLPSTLMHRLTGTVKERRRRIRPLRRLKRSN
jgi:hypothetical protein